MPFLVLLPFPRPVFQTSQLLIISQTPPGFLQPGCPSTRGALPSTHSFSATPLCLCHTPISQIIHQMLYLPWSLPIPWPEVIPPLWTLPAPPLALSHSLYCIKSSKIYCVLCSMHTLCPAPDTGQWTTESGVCVCARAHWDRDRC
jgi:hypothetical protein